MQRRTEVVVRINANNRTHHLYVNNKSNYFVHYTVHLPDFTKARVRQSLRTKELATALQRRDELLRRLRDGDDGGGAADALLYPTILLGDVRASQFPYG